MVDQDKQQRNVVVRFFLGVVRFIRNYFIVVGALVTLLPIISVLLIAYGPKRDLRDVQASDVHLSKDKPTTLRLDLAGKIAEREPGFTDTLMARFFRSEKEIYLPELRSTLRRAGKDARVAGLAVTFGPLAGTPADYTELRRVLADFRAAANKPLTVVLTEAEDWNYYVASAASQIVLNPASPVTIPGPTFQLVYFGEALKKLGVDIDVVRAGKYKSAFEPFVLNQPSEPTLEEYGAMQTSLLDHIVKLVAQGRGKDEATVRGWYKRTLFTGDEAVKAGLVDSLGYAPTAAKDEKVDEGDAVSLSDYAAATRKEPEDRQSAGGKDGLALIEAVGEISMSGQTTNPSSDEGINPRDMTREIRWALEKDEVKAVVLRVSSPGGSAIASDVIWNELQKLAAKKPLVVSMGNYAASGGYYISVPAKHIVAEPTSLTGSIGVIGMLPSVKAFEEKYGVSFYTVTSSDRRSMLNLGSKATPEDKALVDATIDQVYKTFLQKVAAGRHLDLAKVEALAQGRVYTGLQAKELGLVDEIGGLPAAMASAKKLAGFDTNKLYPLYRYEDDSFNLADCLDGPLKFVECLKKGDTRLSLTPFTAALVPEASGLEQTAGKVKGWLDVATRERALALWPDYMALKLR